MDYYDKVSVCNVVPNIKVPVFAFGALDDQLCASQFTPHEKI